MTKRGRAIYRYNVPVDDQPHQIGYGPVLHTVPLRLADSPAGVIEVWVERDFDFHIEKQMVQIFGTGQPLPDGATWHGTCLDGPLVWHLYWLDEEGADR